MIKQPTQIKFFIPTTIEAFDATAEPTLEGIAGEDHLANVIASGGQAINAMDSHVNRKLQADSAGVATVWRTDAAMNNSEDVSFVIVDGHNLATAYAVSVSDSIDIYHNSVDNFGTATKISSFLKQITGQIANDTNFYLVAFTEVTKQYWFINFNEDGNLGDGDIDALIGQIVIGRVFSFNGLKPDGGFAGQYSYPGIISGKSLAGHVQAEERYGLQPSWSLSFQVSTQTQFENMQTMLDTIKGSLYPFYISFDYDQATPVIWRVRMDGELEWDYKHGLSQPWTPVMNFIADI